MPDEAYFDGRVAAEAIRNGSIDTAIVGGVNLLLSPFSYVGFSRASMLSPTGLCRPFDASADGYVRAEGAIVVVLRSMSSALKARSRVPMSGSTFSADEVEIGGRVEMTFRRLFTADDIHNYFWKARPLRSAAATSTTDTTTEA